MNRWIDEWMNRWIDRWVNTKICGEKITLYDIKKMINVSMNFSKPMISFIYSTALFMTINDLSDQHTNKLNISE